MCEKFLLFCQTEINQIKIIFLILSIFYNYFQITFSKISNETKFHQTNEIWRHTLPWNKISTVFKVLVRFLFNIICVEEKKNAMRMRWERNFVFIGDKRKKGMHLTKVKISRVLQVNGREYIYIYIGIYSKTGKPISFPGHCAYLEEIERETRKLSRGWSLSGLSGINTGSHNHTTKNFNKSNIRRIYIYSNGSK